MPLMQSRGRLRALHLVALASAALLGAACPGTVETGVPGSNDGAGGGAPNGAGGSGKTGAGGSMSTSTAAGGGSGSSSAGGSGGPSGAGGAAPGGASGTAGANGSGGSTGTGGRTGAGGASGSGGRTGSGGVTGAGGKTGAGGLTGNGTAFSQCRFHFGTVDAIARANPSMIPQLDFYTPGWMASISDTFDMGYVCNDTKAGGTFANQVPVIVAYAAAFYVKRHAGLADCGGAPGSTADLCHQGAAAIQANLAAIVNVYKSFGQGFAACYGTTRPIIFEMEPDFYQYTYSSGSTVQTQPWTYAQAGQIMGQFVGAMKASLPNALFSMDISPWVGTNNNTGSNGSDNGANWYSNFDMTQFTFINTSGGSTNAAGAQIRGNAMTWAGVSRVTGKPILADTGYGFNGSSAGPDPAWDSPTNINARMLDGVVSISQYNPAGTWGTTIAGIRGQLSAPTVCP
jgi:hypothetical protein